MTEDANTEDTKTEDTKTEDQSMDLPKMKEPTLTSPVLKNIYQVIFVLSVVINLIFSVVTYRDKSRLSELEIEKHTIENRLLLAEHLPSFSSFRLIYEINTLDKFLRSKDQPPFISGNKIYRILDNSVYQAAKIDLEAIKKGNRVSSRITFLTIANTHDATAHAVTANDQAGIQYRLGDLEGHSAVLVPLIYEKSAKSIKIGADELVKIVYQEAAGDKADAREMSIPAAGNVTWTPLLNDFVGVGRAEARQADDDRLYEQLPKEKP
jgi:hypothetical protein